MIYKDALNHDERMYGKGGSANPDQGFLNVWMVGVQLYGAIMYPSKFLEQFLS